MNDAAHRILLVDDDPLVIKVYAERMRFEGWAVAVARDGWEACQEAQRTKFDMILLDIRMPFHNGVAVLKDIREKEVNATTLVYILTSLAEGDDVDDALRLGADGVFFKSRTRPDELVKEVEAILRGAKSHPVRNRTREPATLSAGAGGPATLSAGPGHVEADPLFEASVVDRPEPRATHQLLEDPAPDPDREVSLQRDFTVYVNPFLGDGEELSIALGLSAPYQCPICDGQICLRLSPDLRGEGHEMTGFFLCSRCEQEI